MTNQNIIQRETQAAGFGIMISRSFLRANVEDEIDILRILALLLSGTQVILLSGTQTMIKLNTQIRDHSG